MKTISFLEQLFFGNIDLQCRRDFHPKAMRRAQQILGSLEQTLMNQLPTSQREFFVQCIDAWGTLNTLNDLSYFVCGFRLGAQMALGAFKND